MSLPDNLIDRFTRMNDGIKRTNQLLASMVEADGSVELPENTDPVTYGSITVPDDRAYFGLPSGQTEFDFSEGKVRHQTEGLTLTTNDISGLSRSLDPTENRLRSMYIYVDAPCQLSFDGDNTRTLEAGQHYTFNEAGFTTVTLESDYSFDFTMEAGTRRGSTNVSSSGAHSERKGSRAVGQYDNWEPVIMATPNVWDDFTVTDKLGDREWYVRPFVEKTIQVQNGSDAANNVDMRVMAKDVRLDASHRLDDWYEVARVDGLTQYERHKFVMDEPHHLLRVEFQNSTDGENVGAGCTCVGVN
jgi:hypothetical protein